MSITLGYICESEYDLCVRLIMSKNTIGAETCFEHDKNGNITKKLLADGSFETMAYSGITGGRRAVGALTMFSLYAIESSASKGLSKQIRELAAEIAAEAEEVAAGFPGSGNPSICDDDVIYFFNTITLELGGQNNGEI